MDDDSTHNSGDFKRMDDDHRKELTAQDVEWNHSTSGVEESARHVPGDDLKRIEDWLKTVDTSTSGESANCTPGDFQSMDDGHDIEPGKIIVESANHVVDDPTGTEQGIQLT